MEPVPQVTLSKKRLIKMNLPNPLFIRFGAYQETQTGKNNLVQSP